MIKGNVVKNKSFSFALMIVKLFQYLQNEKKEFVLSKQILRSGTFTIYHSLFTIHKQLNRFIFFFILFFPALLISCSHKTSVQKEEEHPDEVVIDQVKNKFLSELKSDLETHNWKGLLNKCDSGQKRIRLDEMKISEPAFIAEIFGINQVDNSVVKGKKEIIWNDLNKIKKVEFTDEKVYLYNIEIDGKITMDDGSNLNLKLSILTKGNTWYIGNK